VPKITADFRRWRTRHWVKTQLGVAQLAARGNQGRHADSLQIKEELRSIGGALSIGSMTTPRRWPHHRCWTRRSCSICSVWRGIRRFGNRKRR
jgi:hypothetical protein